MVGRIARTIPDWSRARGYIAAVEDEDTFQAELMDALLPDGGAQLAAVVQRGVRVARSLRTRCSRSSTGTRVRHELLGGSGSGINLSNIRGSTEPLSKGGTASGPVSFMRGAAFWVA